MPSATVTPAFVNPPKEGKTFGSIKGADGIYYGYDPGKFTFHKGTSYQIEFTEKQGQNGNTYRTVTKSIPTPSASNGAPASNGNDTSLSIFVTGVIGRAFHGTGMLPGESEMADLVGRCKRAFQSGMAAKAPEEEMPY